MALPKPQPRPKPDTLPGSGNGQSTSASTPASVPVQTLAQRREISVKAPAFIRAASEIKPRLIVNIQGPEGSGKDHMALEYNRGPIYIHSFDQGLEGVVQKF